MKSIGTKEIQTERLLLRRMAARDIPVLHALGCLVGSAEEVQKRGEAMLADYQKPLCFHWVIEYEGRAVGRIRAWEVDPFNDHCQLGYDVAADCRNRGIMTEALHAVLRFLLIDADCHRVFCQVRAGNAPSIRVCEHCGMTYEGRLREHYKCSEGFDDVLVYALLQTAADG